MTRLATPDFSANSCRLHFPAKINDVPGETSQGLRVFQGLVDIRPFLFEFFDSIPVIRKTMKGWAYDDVAFS